MLGCQPGDRGSIPLRAAGLSMARSSSGVGPQVLNLPTGVRFPHGSLEARNSERGTRNEENERRMDFSFRIPSPEFLVTR